RLLGHRPRLTLHVRFCFCASPWRGSNHCAAADACPAPAEQSVAHSCRAATHCRTGNGPRKGMSVVQKWDRHEKRAAVAGGSKSKQGGVKQSGQEPLNVQKMDAPSNDRESLTRS